MLTSGKWIGALAVTGVFVAGTSLSTAATLHVDNANPQCSDLGSGSSSVPFCTISEGALSAVAGDTVEVNDGTYSENVRVANSGTSGAPIVLRPASGANVSVTSSSRAFEVSNKSWIRIEGFTVTGTASYGIYLVNASNVTVASNVVTGSGAPALGSTAPGIYVGGSTDCTISGNNVNHNSDAGIYVSVGSTRILVLGNESSFNARGYIAAAPGIDIRSGGNTLRGNLCHDNEDSGIQVYGVAGVPSPDNLIVNNACHDNDDHGIDISSAGSQRIIGNSVYRNRTAGINVEGASGGTLISNNITAENAINLAKGNLRVDINSISGTVVDYNQYYFFQLGQTQIVWGPSSYATLSDFVTATGQEQNGLEADPKWAGKTSGDFHLLSSSPAIDSANSGASGAQSTDLEGLPRVDNPAKANTGAGPRAYDDRGAYEYQIPGTCGNGIRESGEACDRNDLGGATCASSGFFCGTGSGLSCNSNCTLNTDSCVASCPATDQCHSAGTCSATTDRCTNPVKSNGATCNDANACTQADTCQSGVCIGSNPVVCTPSDACHTSACNTTTGVCSNVAKSNGTACNDANACTRADTCQSGVCTGANPVVCTASDSCHTVGTCAPATGLCSNPTKSNGASCNDGNGCTQTDTCQSGTCTGSNPVVCTASDQCHTVGTCNSTTGVCSNPAKSNGTTCDDASACTPTDTCQSGVCTGSNPVVCPASDQCHTSTCNPTTGVCSNLTKSNGTACNDGNACTATDTCQSGVCTGSNPVVCTASDSCHTAGTCTPATGVCSNPIAPNRTACVDGNSCTQTGSCQSGVCVGADPIVCKAIDSCHVAGTCSPATGVCSNPVKPNGTTCNDANACTQSDSCQAGICTGTNPVVCAASDQCHTAGTCNATTGVCSDPAKSNGTTCDDANPNTKFDACDRGVCTGSNLPQKRRSQPPRRVPRATAQVSTP